MQTVLSARVLLGHQETLFQLRSAMAFVATWQDYLADVNSGKIAAANTKLLALAQYDKYPVVPRSEIIARVQPTPSPSPSR